MQDVLAAEARMLAPGQSNDVDEVLNYIAAMNHGLERLAELPLSTRLIREIHQRLLCNVRGEHLTPGELRRSQNWIGPSGCTLNEAIFVPPPPHVVPQAMADLERFLHTESDLPLLVRIGLAHAQFETTHPFLDGNGRVGRLLITFLLCEPNVLMKPILYLSHFFKHHRPDYDDHLPAVRDQGDWERWLRFFLLGIYEVSQQATETARRILSLREQHRDPITAELGRRAANGHRVLEHLYRSPIITVAQVRDLIGVTSRAANDLVARFQEHGILHEITGQKRNGHFAYQSYINLFHTDGPEGG